MRRGDARAWQYHQDGRDRALLVAPGVAATLAALAVALAAALAALALAPGDAGGGAAAASEPMAVSVLPDGSVLATYVHVDPDTGTHLYVTSAGGIYPRDMSRLNGSTAGANAVTVLDLTEGQDDEG